MITLGQAAFSYVYSGLFVTEQPWIHPRRTEKTYEIVAVAQGEVHLREGERRETLARGDVWILRPGTEHEGFSESRGKTSFYWVHYQAQEQDALGFGGPLIRRYNNMALFKAFLHAAHTPGYPSYAVDAQLLALLGDMAHCARSGHDGEFKAVREAAEWIRVHASRRMSVREISVRYGYNEEYFSRQFRRVYGMGLKEYICAERMKAACDLLANTDRPIKQVAHAMGFDNPGQFIHFFTYHKGQSPARFRNSAYHTHMNRR